MKTIFYAFGALLLVSAVTVLYKTTAAADRRVSSVTVSHRPELEYLKAVNSVGPPQDPQLLFLLMAEYANANRQSEGAEFFSARLKEFGPRLTDVQKAGIACPGDVYGQTRRCLEIIGDAVVDAGLSLDTVVRTPYSKCCSWPRYGAVKVVGSRERTSRVCESRMAY